LVGQPAPTLVAADTLPAVGITGTIDEVLAHLIAGRVKVDAAVIDARGPAPTTGEWRGDVPPVEFWRLVRRVIKPGGFVASFGDVRTYDRMVVNIEDAGFEIKDQIIWLRASEVVGGATKDGPITLPTPGGTPEGQACGMEPIALARKPLSERTIAANIIRHGTGALNLKACRITAAEDGKERLPSNLIIDEDLRKALGTLARFYFFTTTNGEDQQRAGIPAGRPPALLHFLFCLITPPGGMVLGPYGEVVTMAIADGRADQAAGATALPDDFIHGDPLHLRPLQHHRWARNSGRRHRTGRPSQEKPGHNFGHNRLSGGQKGQRRQE